MSSTAAGPDSSRSSTGPAYRELSVGLIDIDYTNPAGARQDFHGNWGGDFFDALSRYDGLRAIRLNELGPSMFVNEHTG
ncbi:hypothetical protein BH11ACT6_BH11ACT6_33300 [soil metagenome]